MQVFRHNAKSIQPIIEYKFKIFYCDKQYFTVLGSLKISILFFVTVVKK